jgi:Ca-activated chloride channel family protein
MANEAIAAYLRAAALPEVKPYAEFGLGTVYYSLEERAAGLERFEDARTEVQDKAGYDELLYRIHYNAGIIHFEEGRFEDAAADFKHALEARPDRVDAKRNLELSLLSRAQGDGMTEGAVGKERQHETRTETLFDYLRQKESAQWKSREWIDDSPSSGPDY